MKLLISGLLAALAMVAHPANAPPASPSHQSLLDLMNAHLTAGSVAAPLLNERAPCTEVSDDDASYCAYAVLGSEELNVTRGTIERGSMTIGLDLDRAASKTLLTFDEYLRKLAADQRATFEDRLRIG